MARTDVDSRAVWADALPGRRLLSSDGSVNQIQAPSMLAVVSGQLYLFAQGQSNGTSKSAFTRVLTASAGEIILCPLDTDQLHFRVRAASGSEAILISTDELDGGGAPGELKEALNVLNAALDGDDEQGESHHTNGPVVERLTEKVVHLAAENLQRDQAQFDRRVKSARQQDALSLDTAVHVMHDEISISSHGPEVMGANAFDMACRTVASQMGVVLDRDSHYNEESSQPRIDQFCRIARLKSRTVLLDSGWWNQNAGHMVATIASSATPVALIREHKRYVAHYHDESGHPCTTRVTSEFAATLEDHAHMLYPPLPSRKIKIWDIVQLAFRGASRDIVVMFIAMLFLAGFNVVTPVVLAWIVGWVIPLVQVDTIFYIGGLLLLAAIGSAFVHVVSGFAFLRIETRSSFFVLAAFVDRTLRLPASFFRSTASGDLTQRIMAIEAIRSKLTQSVVSVSVSFLSGFSYVILMFVYDPELGLAGLALVVVLIILLAVFGVLIARAEYRMATVRGDLDAVSFDVFNGIRQVRIQGSQSRMLSRILENLGRLGQATYVLSILRIWMMVTVMVMPAVATIVVFAFYGQTLAVGTNVALESAHFIAFLSALTAFFGSATLLGTAIMTLTAIFPLLKRLKPIMNADLEIPEDRELPADLKGDIEIRDVIFRYDEDAPAVLDGVSIRVGEGEFIAIVGHTGCGKSTLLKLLLGLESPESGQVLYDGTPLENVDPSGIRSQVGVVMQSNKLMPGTIRSTILGLGSNQPVEVAWDAARLASIDQEIENMPMGMLTMTMGSSLSGGQAQRLLIARALVGNPRILFMDEATSALDNDAQNAVTESINSIGATRVVIAHRLSTIKSADRIYVLRDGSVVQEGTFEELAEAEGHFQELMKRQM